MTYLTQEQVDQLADFTAIEVVWSGGNGPFIYYVRIGNGRRYAALSPVDDKDGLWALTAHLLEGVGEKPATTVRLLENYLDKNNTMANDEVVDRDTKRTLYHRDFTYMDANADEGWGWLLHRPTRRYYKASKDFWNLWTMLVQLKGRKSPPPATEQ